MAQPQEFQFLSRRLHRPLVTFDFETTGLSTNDDRVVQFCFKKLHPDGKIDTISMYVNPNYPISRGATGVHGITDANVSCCCLLRQTYGTSASLCSIQSSGASNYQVLC
jgi:DNA polymerase-3 subunit epsilon